MLTSIEMRLDSLPSFMLKKNRSVLGKKNVRLRKFPVKRALCVTADVKNPKSSGANVGNHFIGQWPVLIYLAIGNFEQEQFCARQASLRSFKNFLRRTLGKNHNRNSNLHSLATIILHVPPSFCRAEPVSLIFSYRKRSRR